MYYRCYTFRCLSSANQIAAILSICITTRLLNHFRWNFEIMLRYCACVQACNGFVCCVMVVWEGLVTRYALVWRGFWDYLARCTYVASVLASASTFAINSIPKYSEHWQYSTFLSSSRVYSGRDAKYASRCWSYRRGSPRRRGIQRGRRFSPPPSRRRLPPPSPPSPWLQ